ncbi:MAG: LytTR family DNA-binding domain-containing protein [Bacteroidales bacterium]
MNAIIIEDEPLVRDYLISLLTKTHNTIKVIATADTVKSSICWFKENPAPDVAFMDIRLADGLSFDIFEQCSVPCPVIFTTAYDEYAIRAFKVNSIDYLLKPIQQLDLTTALNKLKTYNNIQTISNNTQRIVPLKEDIKTGYKTRFVIKVGEHLKLISVEDILFFYSKEKTTWLCTSQGKEYPIDNFIDSLCEMLAPHTFFRINRKYLISLKAIKDIVIYSGSRLQVQIPFSNTHETIVSREKVTDFKKWIEGEY